MGGLGWQDLAGALAAGGALAWLVRRWVRHRRRPAPCEECPACDPSGAQGRTPDAPAPASRPGTLISESDLKRR